MNRSVAFASASNRFRSRGFVLSAAAGVGALLASSAQATIITGGNPIDDPTFGLITFDPLGMRADLTITAKKGDLAGFNHNTDSIAETGQVVVLGSSGTGFTSLDKLSANTLVSSSSLWSDLSGFKVNEVHFGTGGDWTIGDTGYFGFSFIDSGNTYYGWGELTYTNDHTGSIDAWAYNDIPGQAIMAGQTVAAPVPEPATTGLLAGLLVLSGAAWLKNRRRARSVVLPSAVNV